MKKLRLATVFSGIGAVEQALKQLNIEHEIVFACDNGERYIELDDQTVENLRLESKTMNIEDKIRKIYDNTGKTNNVKKSYFSNYQISEDRWYEDVRFLNGEKYKDQVDLFVGGSPCQSFSTYGHRRGLEDTRGTLFYDYARLIDEIKPKVFIFENVTGLLNHDNGKTWHKISEVFESLDYNIEMKILNAQDYNLPQLRKRVFVVGIRKNILCQPFSFPQKRELTYKSTDFLDEIVDDKYYLGEKGFNFVTQVSRNGRRARVNQDIIGCQTANQQFNWVGDFRVESPKASHYSNKKIYIGTYNGKPAVARKMTPNELLRLMGFEEFKIVVDDKVMWRQTGNSIAVPVMKAIVESLIETGVFKEDL